MLSMFDLPLSEPVYTFVDGETGEPTHIATGLLLYALKGSRWPIIECEMAQSLVEALERGDLGVGEPHALSLPEAALNAPIIVCEWGDKHIVADGAHRLWRRWKRGDTGFRAYVLPEKVWRNFTIHDAPGDGKFWDHFNRTMKVRS